jgi:predicted DNA-binding protein YlxM (UPF0122 family)
MNYEQFNELLLSGKAATVPDLAEKSGITRQTIYNHINKGGWTVAEWLAFCALSGKYILLRPDGGFEIMSRSASPVENEQLAQRIKHLEFMIDELLQRTK